MNSQNVGFDFVGIGLFVRLLPYHYVQSMPSTAQKTYFLLPTNDVTILTSTKNTMYQILKYFPV